MQAKSVMRTGALVSSILLLVVVLAFAPEIRAEGPLACATLLTTAEVEAALGMKVATADPVEYSDGFTICSWMVDRNEGQLGVNLSFSELKAIREGMVSAESIPEFFDINVSSTRDVTGIEEGGMIDSGDSLNAPKILHAGGASRP